MLTSDGTAFMHRSPGGIPFERWEKKNTEGDSLLKPILFDKVKSIINGWDPVELLAIHCPDDEYHSEIRVICRYIEETAPLNEIDLGKFIDQTFRDYLGKEFNKSLDSCILIGRKIMESVTDDWI